MLENKTVLLGVTGSVAAYKAAGLASMLVKAGAAVNVIMTKNACNFITPTAFETLTKRKCAVDTFARDFSFDVKHISLAEAADVAIIAPASANIIGKLASGIADDMLSTTLMAVKAPVLIAPAMNTAMYENGIVQDNMEKLRRFGYRFIEPDTGRLACGTVGKGRMPSEQVLFDEIEAEIGAEKDMTGLNVLVTAGPTCEEIDPVRYITNRSTGKMGYAMAKAAVMRGARVTLVSGPTALAPVRRAETVNVFSAADMAEAVRERSADADIIIKAAAVADYRPSEVSGEKIKKSDSNISISLERTEDILSGLGANKREGQFLCGFSMETENVTENSRKKLLSKNADMICANSLKTAGAGFGADTNVITVITRDGEKELECMSKLAAAHEILNEILRARSEDKRLAGSC